MKIGLLVTFIFLVAGPSPAAFSQKATNGAQQKAETNKHIAKPSISSAPSANENPAQNAASQKSATVKSGENERAVRVVGLPPRSTGDTVALACTIALTAVGIIGVFVAICTLFKIRDQATETAKAAKAAADSVEAINRQAAI